MRKALITELMAPMVRRGGTALAAYLIGIGATQTDATALVAGLTAGAGIALDLLLSHLSRKVQ